MKIPLPHLSWRRTRTGRGWAYLGAILGGLVSILANIAHSYIPPGGSPAGWTPEPGAVASAVVWPIFLFIAIEILARTDWPAGSSWTWLRWGGATPVALLAAVVSYRHMSGLLAHYGEEPLIAVAGPIAIDGLMVMATGALIATSVHRTGTHHTATNAPADTASTVESAAPNSLMATELPSPFPVHLLPTARFSVTNHRQATGQAITAGQLAARMNIGVDIAHRLLSELGDDIPVAAAAASVNGTPVSEAVQP